MIAWVAFAAGVAAAYAAFVGALLLAGRRSEARALAGLVPDCIVLVGRLARDARVPRARRIALVAVAAYLAMPFDLVPDVIPVAGQLDDAVLVALALRGVIRGAGAEVVRAHWPGPEASLRMVLRLAAR
ncbi:MAG: DUF1232 domain-containing protein [Actinomycetota bacterium]